MVAHVVAPEVEYVWVVAPNGDQAGCQRLGGGMEAPVTADSVGSLPGSGGGSQMAGERDCSLVGGGRL